MADPDHTLPAGTQSLDPFTPPAPSPEPARNINILKDSTPVSTPAAPVVVSQPPIATPAAPTLSVPPPETVVARPAFVPHPVAPVERGSSPIAPAVPSSKQQQWGVVISIVIIVLMVVVGAFYAWGKRIAEQYPPGLLAPSE